MISSFKSKLTVTLVSAAMAALATSVAQADGTINVYNWSDYIDESVLKDFEAETGIKVNYDVFDSNEVLETKLLAGTTGYDIVVPTGSFLSRQIQAGVFQKLDKDALPNLKNMWSVVSQRTSIYDPGNAYSINYLWGTTGIGYNVEAAAKRLDGKPVDSWDIIFNPEILAKFQDCGIHMLDAPTELFPAALNHLGLDPDSHDKADLDKAAELLKTIRPYIQKFHSSEYINALANGDICLAIGWSGDVFQARDRAAEADNGVTINYIIPKEGALMWFDQMAIPTDAANTKGAHLFLDYVMRPDVIAKASNYVVYANGNKASQAYLDAEVLEDAAVYPDADTMENLYVTTPYPLKIQRVVTRAWTSVKSGQ
ncbi:Putrescine-binding periplasmic protein precursor [Pseudovibrio axinellae]|uniref:Putrescine-binding periplasmic protein n=1 Tax=Pseudovibrio axinellae TaxID=989403 RepID=A0A165SWR9_9HYPH|nr:polyamine ABC transporter substrate-binding protein [Pseudovibrio axinellae]KZL04581.1 Putrescine-binding periplasmic protein precursor [Pseudovibrio axinellae]SEQ72360.1 putrescine transport system substrate-binding protein [Pseudovibrio axinellae]